MSDGTKRSGKENTRFARNYAREMVVFTHGTGVHLFDKDGNRYLDFGSGIAVNALGHGDAELAEAVYDQMRKVVHVSNLFTTPPALALAEELLEMSRGAGRNDFQAVQFGNSGAEANEAAIKYARLTSLAERGAGHFRILSFENAFHGRTMGSLSATPQKKYQEKFEPLVPGFGTVPFNDPEALDRLLDDTVAALLVEVVQGEGGLAVMSPETAEAINRITAERGIILVADEIQTGLGRTGTLFASTQVGLKPDIITLSKPLAGGLPLSATLIPARVNEKLSPGDHGTTFGGGPVTAAAARVVLSRLRSSELLDHVATVAAVLEEGLSEMLREVDAVKELRGMGLLRGLVLDFGDRTDTRFPEVMEEARQHGLIVLRSGTNVLRIAPPLIISGEEIRTGLSILREVLEG